LHTYVVSSVLFLLDLDYDDNDVVPWWVGLPLPYEVYNGAIQTDTTSCTLSQHGSTMSNWLTNGVTCHLWQLWIYLALQ